MKQSKRHAQRGVDMGKCPMCDKVLWSTQKTRIIVVSGSPCVIHATCPA